MIIVRPGTKSQPINLQSAMRELHERDRAAVLARLARPQGVPLEESTDFDALADLLDEAATAARAGDNPTANTLVESARALLAPAVEDPGPYEPRDGYDDIEAVFVTVSRAELNDLTVSFARVTTLAEQTAAIRALNKACVATVSGISIDGEGAQILNGDDPLLEDAGIALDVMRCARAYQELSTVEKKACGSSVPSTSASSSAPAALSIAAAS